FCLIGILRLPARSPRIFQELRLLLLPAFLLADVPRNVGSADDHSVVVAHRRNRQGDIDDIAVFSQALGLEVVDPLPGPNPARISSSSLASSGGIRRVIDCPVIS